MEKEPRYSGENLEVQEHDAALADSLKILATNFKDNEKYIYPKISQWEKQEKELLDEKEQPVKVLLGIRLAKIMFQAGFPMREVYRTLNEAYHDVDYDSQHPQRTKESEEMSKNLINEIVGLLREYGYPDMKHYPTYVPKPDQALAKKKNGTGRMSSNVASAISVRNKR